VLGAAAGMLCILPAFAGSPATSNATRASADSSIWASAFPPPAARGDSLLAVPASTPTASPSPTPTPGPVTCPPAAPSPPNGIPADDPVFFTIPSLAVAARVEFAGLDQDGRMQVPSNPCDVAWYDLGPVPGAPGDAVIDGHLDWYGDPAVFMHLAAITQRAVIVVTDANGRQLRFAVTSTVQVSRLVQPQGLFTSGGPPTLSIYTCSGTWDPSLATYTDRLIVTASLA